MGFYERITGEEQPRLRQHSIMAVIGELERGKLTLAQASTALGLSPSEETEAQALLAKIVHPRECIAFGCFLVLTNVGTAYDSIAAAQGLGVALVQTAGISQIIFGVRVNKVGSGTQSWQLWNETDSTEVAVIDDAGAAGIKNLSTTVNFGTPLGAGMKLIRIRAKSTTAADDPVFMGGTVSIRRFGVLTAVELHEVTLLTGTGEPYATAAAMKTRLGV